MTDMEETIAIAYLQRAEDQENKCMLTSKRLIVVHKGKLSSFDREHIKDLGFNQRRILLPLITGGIAAPLSLLAIFLNLYNPWPLMFIFFTGFILFYLGWQQHPVLTVRDGVKEHDFFLNKITPNLKAFVTFARQVLFRGSSTLYYIADLAEWEQRQTRQEFRPAELQRQGYLRALNREQLAGWKRLYFSSAQPKAILHIDPLKLKINIRYEPSEDNKKLYAHIQGGIREEAVLKVEYTP